MDNINSKKVGLEGAPNFRDIGDITSINGSKFIKGIIFRSDELSKITKSDIEIIDKLELKSICDVRTNRERHERRDKVINPKIKIINVPINPENDEVNKIKFLWFMAFKASEFDFEKYLSKQYHVFAFERKSQIKQIFEHISNPINQPALIHCTAGKDRTGFVVALIQLLCGADRKSVLENYLLTNKLNGQRKKNMIDYLRFMSLYRIPAEKLTPLLDAREEYLNDVLDSIIYRFGSIENYLVSFCKVDEATIDLLKASLIASN